MKHGTPSGYVNHGCRCAECRNRNRTRCGANRKARWAERILIDSKLVHPNASHGTTNGYLNYGCRCGPCYAAGSQRNREHRERRNAQARWAP